MVKYKFFNANPLNKKEGDCVCRAISTATQIPYYDIEEKLELVAKLFECPTLCVCCYNFLLTNVFGFTQRFANGTTVGELAKEFSDNVILVRIDSHLTLCEYGTNVDIWNCLNEKADLFWIVE